MRNLIKEILKEEVEKLEEGRKEIIITLATLLSLGISKLQAQEIKEDKPKLMVVDLLADYNKNPKGLDSLKTKLMPKMGEDTNLFINKYLEFLPDKTIIVKPIFIKGLKINYNPSSKDIGLSYTLKF